MYTAVCGGHLTGIAQLFIQKSDVSVEQAAKHLHNQNTLVNHTDPKNRWCNVRNTGNGKWRCSPVSHLLHAACSVHHLPTYTRHRVDNTRHCKGVKQRCQTSPAQNVCSSLYCRHDVIRNTFFIGLKFDMKIS